MAHLHHLKTSNHVCRQVSVMMSGGDCDCGGDNGNSGGHCVTSDGGYVLVIVVIIIMV